MQTKRNQMHNQTQHTENRIKHKLRSIEWVQIFQQPITLTQGRNPPQRKQSLCI